MNRLSRVLMLDGERHGARLRGQVDDLPIAIVRQPWIVDGQAIGDGDNNLLAQVLGQANFDQTFC
jgi:hypothetical protein